MHAKYLQSIRFVKFFFASLKIVLLNVFFFSLFNRSPVNRPNFRIPEVGYRNSYAPQNIFSQFVEPDESKYESVRKVLKIYQYFSECS